MSRLDELRRTKAMREAIFGGRENDELREMLEEYIRREEEDYAKLYVLAERLLASPVIEALANSRNRKAAKAGVDLRRALTNFLKTSEPEKERQS